MLKISIITPSFNQGLYLEQTILSVLNQNYPNLEYIIIDGGSSDNSIEIIKKYEQHLTYWISEKDKGQSDAINKGLKKITGDIFNWLNSDDYYEPNTLQKVAHAFSSPEINIVSGTGRLFQGDTTTGYTRGVDVYGHNLAKTIGLLRMDQPETFYRTSVLKKIGQLNTEFHYLMDRDWWLKYLLTYGLTGICKLEDMMVNYRLHDKSKSLSQKIGFEIEHNSLFFLLATKFKFHDVARFIASEGNINTKLNTILNSNINSEIIRQAFSYYFLSTANHYYEQNKKSKAAFFYKKVVESDLENIDKKLLRKMILRNKIPLPLIKTIRKFTR